MLRSGAKIRSALLSASILTASALGSVSVQAAEYLIDTKDAHAFVQFKIQHLGYSWLLGRFNDFSGSFNFDEKNPEKSSVKVEIDTGSIDSNHAERDKHLRSDDFLDVQKYPKATFVSTSVKKTGEDKAEITGDLTLRGVTKEIVIDANRIGGGDDPWGGYRQGFEGTTTLTLDDFGVPKDLGPASQTVEMYLSIEGIRQ
ncbi:YceI family protein [Allohahella marinimesophila]|uniref:YceI family protein n=1 Tax=Allohahella marinimesophila TaxID=1054972 RepID=A0ABP7NMM4_9GAMM